MTSARARAIIAPRAMPDPARIVSLLPSATEILFALGLGARVVGVSHECDYPAAARALPAVTTTRMDPRASSAEIDRQVRALVSRGLSVYEVDEARLRALAPELIVTQDVCEVCAVPFAQVREAACRLLGRDTAVLSLAPTTLAGVLESVARVGAASGREREAAALVAALGARLDALRAAAAGAARRPRVVALEWLDPPMVAGHWTPELIRAAGGDPVLGHEGAPTGPAPWEHIVAAAPEVLLVIPCGFRVEQTLGEMATLAARPGFASLPAVRSDRVFVADGNAYFNRPGPRLVESAELAAAAIDPARFAARGAFDAGALLRWRQGAAHPVAAP